MWPPVGAVVFDLDGTLIDSRDDIVAAVNHTLGTLDRDPLPAATIYRYVGDGAQLLCARATGLPEYAADLEPVLDTFLDYYAAHPIDHTVWMPGALEALEALGDLPLAICTNKPRRTTDLVLDALGVRSRFAAVSAGGDLPTKKPDPAPLLALADALGLSPAQLVMVGDGPQDVLAGKRAGARTVAVAGGFQPREKLVACEPLVLLDSMAELLSVVTAWRG